MKQSKKCPKCSGNKIEAMDLSKAVSLDFGTFYLGDLVVPKILVCVGCGYSEMWIVSEKDLEDLRKFSDSRAPLAPPRKIT